MIEIEGGELSVAADLAAAMGASLFDARAIEKVLSGSAEGFESLRETYGITTAELQRMGVEVNKTDGLMLRTPEG